RKACWPERNLRLLHRLQASIRIAGAGKRAERKGRRCRGRRAGLAKRRHGGGRSRLHRYGGGGECCRAGQYFATVKTAALLLGIGKGQRSCHDFLPWIF